MASGVAESRCSKVLIKIKMWLCFCFFVFLLAMLHPVGTWWQNRCPGFQPCLYFFSNFMRKNISFLFLFVQKLLVLGLNRPTWVKCYIPISIARRKPFLCSMFTQSHKLKNWESDNTFSRGNQGSITRKCD